GAFSVEGLLLIVPQGVGELVVIFGDQIDIAFVLDRRRRRFQRLVEVGERFLLVLGRHLLVGLDLGDLRLDHAFGADIFLARGLLRRSGLRRRRGLLRRRLFGLCQRAAGGSDGQQGCEAGDTQRGGNGTNELTHGGLLG